MLRVLDEMDMGSFPQQEGPPAPDKVNLYGAGPLHVRRTTVSFTDGQHPPIKFFIDIAFTVDATGAMRVRQCNPHGYNNNIPLTDHPTQP